MSNFILGMQIAAGFMVVALAFVALCLVALATFIKLSGHKTPDLKAP